MVGACASRSRSGTHTHTLMGSGANTLVSLGRADTLMESGGVYALGWGGGLSNEPEAA